MVEAFVAHRYLMTVSPMVERLSPLAGKPRSAFSMTMDLQDNTRSTRNDRGRWMVLGLMTLYLILTAAVGAARSELRYAHSTTAATASSQRATPAG